MTPSSRNRTQIINPYDGEIVDEIAFTSESEISNLEKFISNSTQFYRKTSSFDRSEILKACADKLKKEKSRFSSLIKSEAGKPITLADLEVDRAISVLEWMSAETLRTSSKTIKIDSTAKADAGLGISERFPIGPIFGITPFNFPLNLLVHKVAPAISIGSPIIIKPSPKAPLTAFLFDSILNKINENLLKVILPTDDKVSFFSENLNFGVVSFTGSDSVGQIVKRQNWNRKTILELGGNAWVGIDQSAGDILQEITSKVVSGGFSYSGQSCISVQNIAVHETIYEPFKKTLKKTLNEFVTGDPSNSNTLNGPLIDAESKHRILTMIEKSRCKIINSSDESPYQNHPTILSPILLEDIGLNNPEMFDSVVDEEIFGPVITLRPYSKTDALINSINRARYGLQAGFFTLNFNQAYRFFREIESGGIIINDVPTSRYDHQPYGGVKASGCGREGAEFGIEDYTYRKFLALKTSV